MKVSETQNGIDISDILASFEANAGFITITDSSDNFCSFTPGSVSDNGSYYSFGVLDADVTGTLPGNLSTGDFCEFCLKEE